MRHIGSILPNKSKKVKIPIDNHSALCYKTGTFEGRVSLTYGFKSRHSHHFEAVFNCLFCFAIFS